MRNGGFFEMRMSGYFMEPIGGYFEMIIAGYFAVRNHGYFYENTQIEVVEIKELCSSDEYQLYSDDALFRIYCNNGEDKPQGICTGDLLNAFEEIGLLTAREVAQKLAILCAWHVGIAILFKNQVAIIPVEIRTAKTVNEGVSLLQASQSFMSMATAIWDIRSDFINGQKHISKILRMLLEEAEYSPTIVASLVGVWYIKAKLRGDAIKAPIDIVVETVILTACQGPKISSDVVRNLWSVFNALIEFEHGHKMDESKEREAVEFLAMRCASTDMSIGKPNTGGNIKDRFLLGLTKGTAPYDWFCQSYSSKLVELARGKVGM